MPRLTFFHTADVHLGAWRDERMRVLLLKAFEELVTRAIREKISFLLIAGDFFNNPLPGIDVLRFAAEQLERLRRAGIPVYAIAGSHDVSETGKTLLDVYHHAGLLTRVDPTSTPPDPEKHAIILPLHTTPLGITLAGMPGMRNGNEAAYYKALDHTAFTSLPKPSIFLFHTQLDLITTPSTTTTPSSLLPPGFSYYAGGHVHIRKAFTIHAAPAAYPGPLFPNSLDELESLQHGSYVKGIINEHGNIEVEHHTLSLKPVTTITLTFQQETSSEATERILTSLPQAMPGMILIIKLTGTLLDLGIDWHRILKTAYARGAYAVLRHTHSLTLPSQERVKQHEHTLSEEDILSATLREAQLEPPFTESLVRSLITILSSTPEEGERKAQYEERLRSAAAHALKTILHSLTQDELRKLQKTHPVE